MIQLIGAGVDLIVAGAIIDYCDQSVFASVSFTGIGIEFNANSRVFMCDILHGAMFCGDDQIAERGFNLELTRRFGLSMFSKNRE